MSCPGEVSSATDEVAAVFRWAVFVVACGTYMHEIALGPARGKRSRLTVVYVGVTKGSAVAQCSRNDKMTAV